MNEIYMNFPNGRTKALTLSYDDGVEQDIKLIEIMKKYGLKGTFNLNSGLYAAEGYKYPEGEIHRRMSKSRVLELYKDSGMEIAVHTSTHPHIADISEINCINEVLNDRLSLEKDFERIVRGMAYPFGQTSDKVVEVLRQCGIVYARTTRVTHSFAIPSDWLRLPATCHHNDPKLMELAEDFVNSNTLNPKLFYIWGHSYEFEMHNNWNVIEKFAEYIGNREDIWYATNIEIYDYVEAYKRLVFSADGHTVFNPTNTELFFTYNKNKFSIKAGETIRI